MMTVDPASPDFMTLPPRAQARVYYFDIGWDERAIADELDVRVKVVDRWLDYDAEDEITMRPRKPRQTNRDYSQVYALYEAGRTPRQIIAQLGLPTGNVYRALQAKYGDIVKPAPERQGELTAAETGQGDVCTLYVKDGLSIQEIADRLGKSYSWVRSRLLEAGVKPRSKGHRGII